MAIRLHASQHKDRLSTALDHMPDGPVQGAEGRVTGKLPQGVTNRELYSDVVRIAWPGFVELILTQLASMVDLMMVGSIGGAEHTVLGAQALSAVGLTNQPKFLLMAAFIAMNTGVTAMVARCKGTGEREKANLVVRQGLLFTFVSTLILSIIGIIFSRPMVIFMGSTEETVTLWATQYLQIQLAGFLTMALTSTITAALRGVGDSRSSMIYNLIANAVNVVFNYLLIYGNFGFPEMGVAGASIATVIGQLVAFVIALGIILRGNGFLKLEMKKGFRWHAETMGDLLHIGLPSMVEQLLMRVGMIVFSITVASLGTLAFATHQICMNIQALSFMLGQAFAISSTTLVGQSLGKQRPDMAEAYCSRCQRIGMVISLLLTLLFALFGGQIVAMYNQDPQIIAMGRTIMLFLAFVQPFQASQFIVAGGLRGAGDTRATAVITTITMMIIRPVLALILVAMGLGIYGAWIALAADQMTRTLLVFVRYRRGKWKTIRLKSESGK
ncbi:MAG: MATE family efflux transporter [Clostridia bacterium]|nr:MATE family efflux transporter [Clostridia bacterium]